MLRRIQCLLAFLLLASCNVADSRQAPAVPAAPLAKVTDHTADELVGRYVAAIGGLDAWRAIRSLRMTGKFIRPGIPPAPIVIEKLRPYQMMRRLQDRDLILQGRDGDTLWEVFPPTGVTVPSPMNPVRAGYFRHWAAIDSPLVDYKAKGSQAELLGRQRSGGKDLYVLKLTFKDGGTARFYLDAQSYLLVEAVESRTLGGQVSDADTVWSDFRRQGGVLWPFVETTTLKAMNIPQTMRWETIEVNPAIDPQDFKMPKG